MKIFPERNLPPSAEPWGKDAEVRFQRVRNEDLSVRASQQNLERSQGGQLSVLSNQVDQLFDRAISVLALGDTSVSGNRTSAPWPTQITPVQFPPVGRSGSAFLIFQAVVSSSPAWTSSPGFQAPLPVILIYQGSTLVSRAVTSLPTGASIPNEFSNNLIPVYAFGRVAVPEGQPLDLEIHLIRGSGSTSSTITMSKASIAVFRDGVA